MRGLGVGPMEDAQIPIDGCKCIVAFERDDGIHAIGGVIDQVTEEPDSWRPFSDGMNEAVGLTVSVHFIHLWEAK